MMENVLEFEYSLACAHMRGLGNNNDPFIALCKGVLSGILKYIRLGVCV